MLKLSQLAAARLYSTGGIRPKGLLASRQALGALVARRTAVTNWSGGLLGEPTPLRFGILKILATMVPGLYVGAFTAKTLAEWMEETELFVPEDDDDD